MTEPKSTNPKDKIGRTKPPLHLIPPTAAVEESVVMGLGAEKYGEFNWREHSVAASVYIGAAYRHLASWYDGETIDPESGANHLAHARACLGIILDAEANGKLVDDRPDPGRAADLIKHHTKTGPRPLSPEERESVKAGLADAKAGRFAEPPDLSDDEEERDALEAAYQYGDRAADPSDDEPGVDGVSKTGYTGEATLGNPLPDALQAAIASEAADAGCRPSVAKEIAKGVRVPLYRPDPGRLLRRVYVAGPMRGYDEFNFPAFDRCRNMLLNMGDWAVISPADIDRASGIDENEVDDDLQQAVGEPSMSREFAYRDFHALHLLKGERGDAIAMLPGWEKSTGATAEFFLARWLGLRVLDGETGRDLTTVDILSLLTKVSTYLAENANRQQKE